MPVLTPDLFWLTAQELLDCVCAALDEESECPCPCRVCVVAGTPVWDECCEGQLTAYLSRVFFHDNFPSAVSQAQICGTFLAGEIVIQLLRCAPVVHDDGSSPTCGELSESARKIYQELYISMRALACCLSEAKRHRKYVITDARTVGPEGGCVGFEIRVTIELHDPLPGTQ